MTHRPRHIKGKRVSSPEYRSWQMMRNRCNNPKADDYPYYGGRGISVCPAWGSYDQFLRDVGPRPSPLHTLDRKDPDQNYGPDNCCWATRREQSRNRRFIKRYYGLATWEWAEKLGIKHASFSHRLWRYKSGLIDEKTLFKPNRRRAP